MSDISINFTGIILLGVVALGAILYALIAGIALIAAALQAVKTRALHVAGAASLMALGSLLVAAWIFPHLDYDDLPNWIDDLALPWIAIFVAGCWQLTRIR